MDVAEKRDEGAGDQERAHSVTAARVRAYGGGVLVDGTVWCWWKAASCRVKTVQARRTER